MSVPANSLLDMLKRGVNGLANGPASPYLSPEEQTAVNQQRKMAMIATLLQGAAPRPQGTGSTLGDLGNALAAGQHVQGAGIEQALKARLVGLQMQQAQAQMAAAQSKASRPSVVPAGATLVGDDGKPLYTAPVNVKPPEVSDASKKVSELEAALGRKLTDRERFTIMGAGELFKPAAADDLDKPLTPTDLARLRLPDGSSLPFGTTNRQAMQAGAKAFSDTELTRQVNTSTALNTLSELKGMALGKNGAFVDNGGSPLTNNVLARIANGISNGIGSLFGTEASVRRDVFNTTAQGSISSLVRSMGEAGSLSDGDVKRALSLIPALGAKPDTEATARVKFDELQKIISRGASGLAASNTQAPPEDPLGIR